MELIELEKQLEALQEQIKSMKSADESCDKLTEAEDEKIETEEEKVEETETPEVENVETEEDKKNVEFKPEETEEIVDDNAVLVDNISKELLRSLMSILDDINLIGENLEDDKYIAVFDEVKEHVNKAIGSVQAVVADGSEDAQIQDEAREEAENIIDDANDQSLDADANEDDVEVIKPVDGEEEEIEEVDEKEVEESIESSDKPSINEDLKVFMGLTEFEPWGPAEETFNYIENEIGLDAIDSILEELWPDGVDETTLNDLFAYDDDVYELFGVKDPYAEDEDDKDEVEESCKVNESPVYDLTIGLDGKKSSHNKARRSLKSQILDIVHAGLDELIDAYKTDEAMLQNFIDNPNDPTGEEGEDSIEFAWSDSEDFYDFYDEHDEYYDNNMGKIIKEAEQYLQSRAKEVLDKKDESCNPDDIDESTRKCHRR